VRTFADHDRAIAALHTLATEYPLLPAASISITPQFPDELVVSCFSSLADFEKWREALHADTVEVEHEITGVDQVHLIAVAKFDGVTVLIHGYSPRVRPQVLKAVAA
jgi:hypothetical protein